MRRRMFRMKIRMRMTWINLKKRKYNRIRKITNITRR
jgi:hypothetical protein